MSLRNLSTQPVVVCGGLRSPFAKVGTQLSQFSVLDLLKQTVEQSVQHFRLQGVTLGDVVLGTVLWPPTTWNLSREAVLASSLAHETPALGIQRACGTGMDAIISAASRIALGHMDSALAGGAESMSVVPVYLKEKLSRALVQSAQAKTLKDKIQAWGQIGLGDLKLGFPGVVEATTGMSMGQHCELMAKEWKISRADQDQLAYESHQKAAAAYSRGFYTGLIHSAGKLDKDNIVRGDTNLERLAKLKPVFDPSESGTLTAGNSSALTDGASIVLLGSETFVKERGYERLAYLTEFQNAAVNIQREGLLMAPTVAVGQMLKRAGLELQDFDFYEIHEAFAAQVLCTLKAWESDEFCQKHLGRKALGSIDRSKMNVAGGSLALGHPFAATGARIVATAAKLLAEKGRGRCLISICTGGGMATTAILERP